MSLWHYIHMCGTRFCEAVVSLFNWLLNIVLDLPQSRIQYSLNKNRKVGWEDDVFFFDSCYEGETEKEAREKGRRLKKKCCFNSEHWGNRNEIAPLTGYLLLIKFNCLDVSYWVTTLGEFLAWYLEWFLKRWWLWILLWLCCQQKKTENSKN